MIRVNLLPSYVAQRRLNRRLITVYVLAVVLVGSAMGVYTAAENTTAIVREQAADAAQSEKDATDARTQAAQDLLTAVQPTETKLQFVDAVHAYTEQWVRLYDTLARYTDMKIIYSSAQVNGKVMSMHAYTPSIAEIGRYLEEIYNEPDFATVSIDHLPGYPEGIIKKFYLDGKLVGIGTINGAPAGMGQGEGQQPGMGMGGPPAGIPGFGGGGGGFGGGGFGGGGATSEALVHVGGVTLSRSGERVYSVLDVLGDRLNPLATTDERNRAIQQALKRVVIKSEPKGFDVNVTATLKQQLTPPAIPSGGGSPATTSRGGAPGGGYPGGGYPGAGSAGNGGSY